MFQTANLLQKFSFYIRERKQWTVCVEVTCQNLTSTKNQQWWTVEVFNGKVGRFNRLVNVTDGQGDRQTCECTDKITIYRNFTQGSVWQKKLTKTHPSNFMSSIRPGTNVRRSIRLYMDDETLSLNTKTT